MTEKTETDKSGKRHGIGKFIDRIFRSRSYSLPTNPSGSGAKDAKKKRKRSSTRGESIDNADDVFGIVETERLQHFQKPRPPANRRRPGSVAQASASATSRAPVAVMGSRPSMTDSSTSTSSASVLGLPKRSEPIKEEDDELQDDDDVESRPEKQEVVVQDKKVEATKLFTPPLPPTALKPKLKLVPEISPKAVDEVDEDVRKSDSIEVISESEVSLRKTSDVNGVDETSSSMSTSTRSSLSLLSSKSFSAKIDFEQIRAKSKNLRLVKSLEVGQKLAGDEAQSGVRVSDPGRQ